MQIRNYPRWRKIRWSTTCFLSSNCPIIMYYMIYMICSLFHLNIVCRSTSKILATFISWWCNNRQGRFEKNWTNEGRQQWMRWFCRWISWLKKIVLQIVARLTSHKLANLILLKFKKNWQLHWTRGHIAIAYEKLQVNPIQL